VNAAGDLDGNGRGDIIIGAAEFPDGDPGKAFVYFDNVLMTAVSDGGAPGAHGNLLAQNFPNPFKPPTIIRYRLSASSRVAITIHDVAGALVRRLVDESQGRRHAPDGLGWAERPGPRGRERGMMLAR
jgi:hypothetical protein